MTSMKFSPEIVMPEPTDPVDGENWVTTGGSELRIVPEKRARKIIKTDNTRE